MLTPTCSKCHRVIPGDDINVANDVAYCRQCNLAYKLSELAHTELDLNLNLNNPPAGAWYLQDGTKTVAGATNRSWGMALGMLAAGLFWNGIVSVFVLANIAGTLHNMHISLPAWFPAPKMDGGMSVGMTIFLWIFLTPFMAIGLIIISTFFSAVAGKTEVQIQNDQGTVFIGIGPIGIRRRFNPGAIKEISVRSDQNSKGQQSTFIVLETREGRLIKFGTLLREDRRNFLAAVIRRTIGG